MGTQDSNPAADFQTMARQSLEAWQQMWTQAAGQAPGMAQGWPAAGGDAAQRVLDGLKGYMGWMENLAGASAAAPDGLRWNEAVSRAFGSGSENLFNSALAGLPGIDGLDPQALHQQILKFMAPAQRSMDGMLSLPMFGLAREHQEHAQALGRAWLEYLQQSGRYQALVARAGRQASDHVQDLLGEHEEPGRQIDSLRSLYNLWVDAAEEAWAEVAMSDEYREVYGAMTNAQMRVRQLVQQQVAESSRELGMPSRDEVDSLGRRLQELRREVAQLRQALQGDAVAPVKPAAASHPRKKSTTRAATRAKAAPARKTAAKKTVTKKSSAGKSAARKTGATSRVAASKGTARKSVRKTSAGLGKKKGS